MNKKFLISIILILGFIGSTLFATPITPALSENATTNKQNTTSAVGSSNANGWTGIPGTNISYRYGMNSFNAHNTFQVENNGTSADNYTQQSVQNLTLNLVNLSSVVYEYVVWNINQTVYTIAGASTNSFRMDNNTFSQYVATYNTTYFSGNLVPIAYNDTGVYGVTNDTMIVTNTSEYVGNFPTNNTFIEYRDPILNENITFVLSNYAIVISYTPIYNVPVTLKVTYNVYAAFAYFNAYNVTYNIQAEQWLAQVRDGNRMAMSVSGFKDLKMNYTEIRFSVLNYYIQSSLDVNLTYSNTGLPVNFTNYPFALRPSFFQQSGSMDYLGIRYINTTSLMASTTAVQAFYAQVSKDLNNTHVSASDFVEWMVSSTPRLFAYKDANLNNQLDLSYDPSSGIQVSGGDYIPYVGVLEASSGNAITYQSLNQSYTQRILGFQGLTFVNQTNNYNNNATSFNQFHYGFGSVNSNYGFNPYFNTPVNDSNTWVFDFGVEYQNFPVTWYDMTTGASTTDPMNITYAYEYRINPYLGTANLSPTVTYGAVTNSTLKAALSGLSLATIYESDFLSVATLKASRLQQANTNVTSSITSNFASLSFSGPQNNITNINTGGKANYTLDGVTYTSNAGVMNLASFSGTAVSANVTTFSSDNQNIAGSAMMQNATITGVSLNYRKDLIIISYPEYSGGEIIHDPTFSAVYQQDSSPAQITASSADQTIPQGTSITLQWQVNDLQNNGGTYSIQDETNSVVQKGNWQPGNTITYTVTPTVGVHSYTLKVTDSAGYTASHTIKVTVTSGTGSNSNSTAPLVTSSKGKITTAAPGFTLDVVLATLSVALIAVVYKRRRKE